MLLSSARRSSSVRLARPLSSVVDAFSWRTSPLVDASKLSDALVSDGDLLVMPELITEDEERVVADECAQLLKRRRYEVNHWDQVIIKFKEMERSKWSAETARVLDKVRAAPVLPTDLTYRPSVHVIDLAEDGYIMPHVDAIKVRYWWTRFKRIQLRPFCM
jgi:alkylated DNA repair protein alkB homolog 7